jgi:hypothetical protein
MSQCIHPIDRPSPKSRVHQALEESLPLSLRRLIEESVRADEVSDDVFIGGVLGVLAWRGRKKGIICNSSWFCRVFRTRS